MTGRDALRIILRDLAQQMDATRLRQLAAETSRRMGEGGEWGDYIRTMGTVAQDWGDEHAVLAIIGATGRLERLLRRTPITDLN
jgi:hypothetical protein